MILCESGIVYSEVLCIHLIPNPNEVNNDSNDYRASEVILGLFIEVFLTYRGNSVDAMSY